MMMTIAIKYIKLSKKNSGLNGIRTHDLCDIDAAQLVGALHRYCSCHGFESRSSRRSSLNFFRLFFYQPLKLISLTARVIIYSSHKELFQILILVDNFIILKYFTARKKCYQIKKLKYYLSQILLLFGNDKRHMFSL